MKRLLIVRHAKAVAAAPGLHDFDRPLSDRGRKDARRIGREIEQQHLLPELVLVSSAARTVQTLEGMRPHLPQSLQTLQSDELYLAPPGIWLSGILAADASVQTLLCIGHNPGLEQLVAHLSGSRHRLPTAALAVFDVGENWSTVTTEATLLDVVRVKDLPDHNPS